MTCHYSSKQPSKNDYNESFHFIKYFSSHTHSLLAWPNKERDQFDFYLEENVEISKDGVAN